MSSTRFVHILGLTRVLKHRICWSHYGIQRKNIDPHIRVSLLAITRITKMWNFFWHPLRASEHCSLNSLTHNSIDVSKLSFVNKRTIHVYLRHSLFAWLFICFVWFFCAVSIKCFLCQMFSVHDLCFDNWFPADFVRIVRANYAEMEVTQQFVLKEVILSILSPERITCLKKLTW